MPIVYHCFGGAHSSPVAAAIHLGMLPLDGTPPPEAIRAVPHFDTTPTDHWGRLLPMGQDAHGHAVFVMGHGPHAKLALQALLDGYRLAGGDPDQLVVVDTLRCVNVWMRVGGYLSRRLGLVRLGRPLVIWGTRRAYPRLASLVRETLARCSATHADADMRPRS
ncbi:MAG TPA: DUF3189 family protein [Limnochordales bacterium]